MMYICWIHSSINSACFVGRQDDLEEINELLAKNQLVFLSGIGGIGKTELAKQYAYRHRAQYDTVFSQYMRKYRVTCAG